MRVRSTAVTPRQHSLQGDEDRAVGILLGPDVDDVLEEQEDGEESDEVKSYKAKDSAILLRTEIEEEEDVEDTDIDQEDDDFIMVNRSVPHITITVIHSVRHKLEHVDEGSHGLHEEQRLLGCCRFFDIAFS